MNRISKLFAMSVLTLLLLCAGCGDDGSGPSGPGPYNAMTLDLYDMDHLAQGYFYQIWVANSGAKLSSSTALDWVSVAEFNVNPVAGNSTPDVITKITGQVVANNTLANLSVDFEKQDTLMITIEAPGSISGQPSATVVGVAEIPEDFAQRTIGILEFPVDVDSTLGFGNTFQFATPTDADTSNELSGVWFALHIDDLPTQSLNLRHAPAGWIYEGWAWHDNTWLSTGQFTDAGESDNFSDYSLGAGIGFPGEDFLNDANAPVGVTFPWTFAIGDSVLITLEPSPDPEDGPSAIRLLGFGMMDNRPPHVATQLTSPVQLEPNGSVTFKRSEDL